MDNKIKLEGSAFITNANTGDGTINWNTTGVNTSYLNLYNQPVLKETREVGETIEMIYEEESIATYTPSYGSWVNPKNVFKIVFSCKDGKWHKSERIYGKIIPAQSEYYEF
jgi:hypothetical protein